MSLNLDKKKLQDNIFKLLASFDKFSNIRIYINPNSPTKRIVSLEKNSNLNSNYYLTPEDFVNLVINEAEKETNRATNIKHLNEIFNHFEIFVNNAIFQTKKNFMSKFDATDALTFINSIFATNNSNDEKIQAIETFATYITSIKTNPLPDIETIESQVRKQTEMFLSGINKISRLISILSTPLTDFGVLSNAALESLKKFGEFSYEFDDLDDFENDFKEKIYENGKFHGQLKYGQRSGRGRMVWNDGSVYEGYWKNDLHYKYGRLIHSDGNVYIGEWKKGKANGKGKYFRHSDQSCYEGNWVEDRKEGFGVEKWPDGSYFTGCYQNGMKDGEGSFVWADGSTYKGGFSKNKIDGFGIYNWADGRCYEGDWVQNKMEGKGVHTWKDGKQYNGEYLDDKKHGFGKMSFADGKWYEGGWKDGRMHGEGSIYNLVEIKKGVWEEGRLIKYIEQKN